MWGVYVNNLKNIDIDILFNEFVVIIGCSGFGKLLFVMGVLYVEGVCCYLNVLLIFICCWIN